MVMVDMLLACGKGRRWWKFVRCFPTLIRSTYKLYDDGTYVFHNDDHDDDDDVRQSMRYTISKWEAKVLVSFWLKITQRTSRKINRIFSNFAILTIAEWWQNILLVFILKFIYFVRLIINWTDDTSAHFQSHFDLSSDQRGDLTFNNRKAIR